MFILICAILLQPETLSPNQWIYPPKRGGGALHNQDH